MTFHELLEKSATDLEAMSDEQLLEYLGPCLKDCPPIDIAIVNAAQDKIKEEKQKIKDQLKEQRRLEREAKGLPTRKPKVGDTKVVEKQLSKMKPEDKRQLLEQLNSMNQLIEMQMKLQVKK